MTATVQEVEAAVVATLSTIGGLQGFDYLPDSFPVPCAIVAVGDVDYHSAFGNGVVEHDVAILVIVGRSSESAGDSQLDDFRSYSGTTSLRAAIEADGTLGGVVATSIVTKSTPKTAISINGAEYLAAEFTMTVYA